MVPSPRPNWPIQPDLEPSCPRRLKRPFLSQVFYRHRFISRAILLLKVFSMSQGSVTIDDKCCAQLRGLVTGTALTGEALLLPWSYSHIHLWSGVSSSPYPSQMWSRRFQVMPDLHRTNPPGRAWAWKTQFKLHNHNERILIKCCWAKNVNKDIWWIRVSCCRKEGWVFKTTPPPPRPRLSLQSFIWYSL